MEFFLQHQKHHVVENHAMEIHVRRGLTVLPSILNSEPQITMIKKDLKKCKKFRILMLKLHDLAYTYL